MVFVLKWKGSYDQGLVDLYDGDKHLKQCLIVASKEENGIVHFEYKRNTNTQTAAPRTFIKKKRCRFDTSFIVDQKRHY